MQLREDPGPLKRRAKVVLVVVFVVLGALHMRIGQLQVIDRAMWHEQAENNRVRRVPVQAARGRIFDRRGRVLADNGTSWELLLFPDEAVDLDRTALFLARIGIGSAEDLRRRIAAREGSPLAPMLVGENLAWSEVAAARSHQSDHPELSVVPGSRRIYPYADLFAHAIGYLRLASRAEIDSAADLHGQSLVGATGLEALYDLSLRGRDGERLIVANAIGRQLGVVREDETGAGQDLTVTLDLDLQRIAAEALGDLAGAVVAMDARSGALRVLYSAPSFDPNVFVGRLPLAEWAALRDDLTHPLQNRCLQGVYPPASTVKPLLATGALHDGLVTPDWGVFCQGSLTLYGHTFRCWWRGGHGWVTLQRSLAVSCDVYYYQLGQRLGIDGIARWLRRFGLGSRTGIGLAIEREGLVGTPEWSARVRGTPWYAGEAVSVSIGQGPVLATVLQMARAYAALANGGRLVVPHMVEGAAPTVAAPDLHLQPELLAQVVQGLEAVVGGPEGTARGLAPLSAAGKTGTAQVARLQEGVRSDDLDPRLRHHAWFVGWAPRGAPTLVVAVLVEHGGGGGAVAAPIAGTILRAAIEGDAGAAR